MKNIMEKSNNHSSPRVTKFLIENGRGLFFERMSTTKEGVSIWNSDTKKAMGFESLTGAISMAEKTLPFDMLTRVWDICLETVEGPVTEKIKFNDKMEDIKEPIKAPQNGATDFNDTMESMKIEAMEKYWVVENGKGGFLKLEMIAKDDRWVDRVDDAHHFETKDQAIRASKKWARTNPFIRVAVMRPHLIINALLDDDPRAELDRVLAKAIKENTHLVEKIFAMKPDLDRFEFFISKTKPK